MSRSIAHVLAALLVAPTFASTFASCSSPCTSPIRYRVSKVDSRFGIDRDEVLAALRQAEAIWEKQAGRDLFAFADDGDLDVNFVYDARQLVAQENASRKDTIERTASSAESVKARYQKAKSDYEGAKKDYETAKARHEARVAAHNREVDQWNARGGAPPDALDALASDEDDIRASAEVLEKGRLAINSLAEEANELSGRFNDLASEVNENVTAINTTAGREFQQGRYVVDPKGRHIDIFEFVDRVDLVHVLAHEFGHALGLEHNDDASSIMYGENSNASLRLARGDVAALNARCRLR